MTAPDRPADAPGMRLRQLRWLLPPFSVVFIAVSVFGCGWWGWPPLPFAAIALLLVAVSTDGIARPSSSLFYPTLSHGPRGTKRVALSFDDGPDPAVTPQVLDVLARHGARATFFVIGSALEAQPELARRMVREGHVIGNHSWQHSPWQNFCGAAWHARELARGEEAVAGFTGQERVLYRPPIGLKSPELGRAVWTRGLTLVAWSLHSKDTRDRDPASIARRVLARAQGGDIVLLHDGHHLPGGHREHCAEALRIILEGLEARGLECVTVPELLGLSGGA
ncbi:MAG: polysaccharide deacetylase family protein [Bacillota bacterium]